MFPNAANGVKKIYTAEILMLIATLVSIIAAIAMVIGGATAVAAQEVGSNAAMVAAGGSILGAGLFVFVAAVLSIIAFIMNIVGVKNAAKDEEQFKAAMTVIIIGIICALVTGLFRSVPLLAEIAKNVTKICEILTTFYILSGIIHLAEQLGDTEMSSRGQAIRKLILIIWVISLVINIISSIFTVAPAMTAIGGVLAIVALAISLVSYIMYLRLLSQARKMLGA